MLDRAANLDNRGQWHDYVSWLVDRVDKIRKAFGPHAKALNLTHEVEEHV